jgi:hypothetical protein
MRRLTTLHRLNLGRFRLGAHELDSRPGFTPGLHVARTDVEDTVHVDLERYGNLSVPTRRGRDPGELQLTEKRVLRKALALALSDAHTHRRLAVARRGECASSIAWNGRVGVDEHVAEPSHGLDVQRKRRHVD